MNALVEILNHPVVLGLGSWLLHFTWQGTVVALFLGLFLRIGRHASSEARYAGCWVGLALMIVLPTLTILSATSFEDVDSLSKTTAVDAPANDKPFIASIASINAPAQLSMPGMFDSLSNLRAYFVLIWILGLVVFSFRLHLGFRSASRIKNRLTSEPADYLHQALETLCHKMNIQRSVDLRSSSQTDQPILIGWLKPMILLPASILTALPPCQVEAILAHELAHVKRHDYFFSVIQSVFEALFFFQPAVWWISHQISIEREYCCDKLAVFTISNKKVYLQTLADLEVHRMSHAAPAFSLAMSDGSLLNRVKRITLLSNQKTTIKSRTAIMGIILFVCLSIITTSGINTPFATQQVANFAVELNQADDTPSLHPLMHKARITSGFGQRYHPILKEKKMHNGIDFQSPVGSPVYATANGMVKVVTESENHGKYIVISHAGGFETMYTTLSTQEVGEGAIVKKGDKIGESGNTGLSTAPHLHYEVRLNGEYVDPVDYLPEE